MATCDIGALQKAACDNGFMALARDRVLSQAVELELWKELSGDTSTIGQLFAAACTNGFMQLQTPQAKSVQLQLLCDLTGGT